MKDATPLFIGVALIATLMFYQADSIEKLAECRAEYQGFKDGIIYGKQKP
ncbi:hypothetical protein DSM106972_075280 [Dulcicalothrix desertica PCC 7102]|uniref:Uncharacterized protein n=1 Tax=Dulcicalothrix desertica PCC 7102 TaxID=232991 RepID=A0A3S1CBT9_9CYAN|nr:hypothetical protein [Dulcicalothrix desertica]RUT00400.1 hypothetical protein DSM106972_075280 [Dulcicalothrix desertica PCC 7102]TWH42507.1 hypothetical protein CAL7102_06169 [Dulcicalothrix desertica PCC 7102]